MSYGMRLDGISAYAPERVWTNRRVAARLRLERMRLRAAGDGPLGPDEAKLFETSDRWVRRGDRGRQRHTVLPLQSSRCRLAAARARYSGLAGPAPQEIMGADESLACSS